MFSYPFLLQTTRTVTVAEIPVSVYIGMIVTLLAALVAAAASLRNTRLSVLTQRDVASISADTARELKRIDYQNDFHKIIVNKRLAAWDIATDLASSMSGILRTTTLDMDKPTEVLHTAELYSYFNSADEFNRILKRILESTSTSFWVGKDYSTHIQEAYKFFTAIKGRCIDLPKSRTEGKAVIDEKALLKAGEQNFQQCDRIIKRTHFILMHEVKKVHDVDAFFSNIETHA